MTPSASEEEQDKEGLETTMPAASEQKQEIEEKELTMAPAASGVQHIASKEEEDQDATQVKEVLELLQSLLELCTALQEAAGPHRVTGEDERRILAFLEVELRYTVMSLKSRAPASYYNQADDRMLRWLKELGWAASGVKYDLERAYPRRHTLLRRARHCFGRSKSLLLYKLFHEALRFYKRAEHPCRYSHLLLSNTDPGLPTPPQQAAKPDGLPLVGIDRPTKKLLRWLIPREETNKSLRVMSIVGPAGIGKTTLAMELHNQLRCQTIRGHNYFEYNVMAQVSRRTNRMKLLLQEILSKISDLSDQPEDMTMDLLVSQISECLQDKRYFICIDDMWEKSDWEEIKGAFPNNNPSRISITTQVRSIAWSCCSDSDGFVHEMKPLNEVDSERLLAKAFGSVDACPPHNFQLVCDEILRRCEGMPSFITGMADWLKEQWQREDELQLQTSAFYIVEQVPRLPKRFEQALSPAYHELPYELRLLALHIGMFPYGYLFEKDRLTMRWLCEGLIEWLDEECFLKLVDRNVITRVAGNCGHNANDLEASRCQVNPFVRQFLATKSAEIGFVFSSATLNLAVAPTTGHGNNGCVQMFFLRYLSIRKTRVSKLPLEIKELRSLELLDLSYTQISELPFEVFNLPLMTLDLRGTPINQLPKQVMGLRGTLRALLLGGEGIINSIDTATRVPHDIQGFTLLRTLATIDLSEHPASFIKALGNPSDLRELGITWSFHQSTDRDYRDALLSSIKMWRRLESLTIHCGLGCSMEFLGSLINPPRYLEKFKVTAGRFAAVPKWIEVLNSLSFLQITVCRLGGDDLKILTDLPKLQFLILGLDFIPGEAIQIGNEGFSKLKRLSIDCPLPWLTFKTGAMRNLEYLQLEFCACPVNQTAVPSGISNLQSLTEVALCYNSWYINSPSVKMIVKAMRNAVAEHPYPIDLFINGFQDHHVQAADEEAVSAARTQIGTDAVTGDASQAVDEGTVRTTAAIQTQCEIEAEGEIQLAA
ncbi:hypothetical protein ACP70R_007402 [Stipagrostis hirtigluma subsp. patula]